LSSRTWPKLEKDLADFKDDPSLGTEDALKKMTPKLEKLSTPLYVQYCYSDAVITASAVGGRSTGSSTLHRL